MYDPDESFVLDKASGDLAVVASARKYRRERADASPRSSSFVQIVVDKLFIHVKIKGVR